jgi:hypothetical protein
MNFLDLGEQLLILKIALALAAAAPPVISAL